MNEYEKIRRLSELTEGLILSDNRDEIIARSLMYLEENFDMYCAIWEYNSRRDVLEPVNQTDDAVESIGEQPEFDRNSVAYQEFKKGEIQYIRDVTERDKIQNPDTEIRTEIIIPIKFRYVIILADTEVRDISDTDLDILKLFVNTVRGALERSERDESLEIVSQVYKRIFRHDIRNRVNIIKGIAKNMERNQENKINQQNLNKIIESSEKLYRTAENVKKVQEVIEDSDSVKVHNISELCTEVISENKQDSVTFTTNIPADIGVRAHKEIKVAINEILQNSIIHNNKKIEISLDITQYDSFTEVTIRDNGVGYPETEIQAIETQKETKLEHGSGTGLWLADRIIYHSGGTLIVENDDGAKSTIILKNNNS